MSIKSVLAVICIAVLVGVLYVSFEKKFLGGTTIKTSGAKSSQELGKNSLTQTQTSLIALPTPTPTPSDINESSNLLNEASNLEMRDYSTLFEELKDKATE